ncbi:SubName: Full=Uncharacterized protein {ECO:0000313/EMBL:CCA70857.1} [Serendipita indica DSM 11827]|uniref:F-box domain-containing protein n=1 Tax=Serendipita indica (strain DSM 11827) TaxID=1109443 RepID=G4THR4_SERID|nr:SubName: Full=Uncharacterized protein {ECO:0000313/EMBL:CCA70857.1} [Serendipita indica DSM 11827]CCA70857.1 hypothetical protein PIIN_04792 [Serendipita indica DSM 11827]
METKEDEVDYLSLLPLEIWHQILLEVYPPIASVDPNSPFIPMTIMLILYIQKMRASLRLVCRKLEPIALEVLFREIIVSDRAPRWKRLLDTFEAGNPTTSLPLSRTTGALICLPWRSSLEDNAYNWLCKLREYCPRIKRITVFGRNKDASNERVEWLSGVESVFYSASFLDSKFLQNLSIHNPSLHTLILCVDYLVLKKPVTFPCVTNVFLSFAERDGLSNFIFPRIRWLGISLSRRDPASCLGFFRTNGLNLDYLELIRTEYAPVPIIARELAGLTAEILNLCPRLAVLKVDARVIDDTKPRLFTLPAHTLILKADDVLSAEIALRWWLFDSGGQVPVGFRKVDLKLRKYKDFDKDHIAIGMLSKSESCCLDLGATFVTEYIL